MTAASENASQTAATRARYNRIAPMYDTMEAFIERAAFGAGRRALWAAVPAGRVLEAGVGTGKNLPFYPSGAQMTAIDISDQMLARARRRAAGLGVQVDLQLMDAQCLEFPDAWFDAAVATFVFCSVPDPVAGLRELGRVVRPGGDIWLLEHVRVDGPAIGPLMDLPNPPCSPRDGGQYQPAYSGERPAGWPETHHGQGTAGRAGPFDPCTALK